MVNDTTNERFPWQGVYDEMGIETVSYTHLTLPTILRV